MTTMTTAAVAADMITITRSMSITIMTTMTTAAVDMITTMMTNAAVVADMITIMRSMSITTMIFRRLTENVYIFLRTLVVPTVLPRWNPGSMNFLV